jgi:pilus assembly protein Flp/PilA
MLGRFLTDETGATAIEYGLIAVGIAMAIIAAISALGNSVLGDYTAVRDAFASL